MAFYTNSEFDIAPLYRPTWRKAFHGARPLLRFAAMAHQAHRELLWQGCWAYVLEHGVDVMVGCASFEGTDPDRLAEPLSFLFHHAAPPAEWNWRRSRARAWR